MTAAPITVAGARLMADPLGALWWPEERLLAVADLHLEKGSAFAAQRMPLPPYDTGAGLDLLHRLLHRYRPRTVVALGDSFHDRGAAARVPAPEAARIRRFTREVDWVWIAGNHDPEPPAALGGRPAAELAVGPLTFRHIPSAASVPGEIAGHLHPKATVPTRARHITGRCFVTDGRRLVLPAFGAYAGGLDVHDPALRGLFRPAFRVFLLGRERLHAFPAAGLAIPTMDIRVFARG